MKPNEIEQEFTKAYDQFADAIFRHCVFRVSDREKAKDIAVLKSMGATSGGIMRIFMVEGLVIGIAGTITGIMGGVAGCMLLKKYQFIKLPSDVYYISTLPVMMDPFLIGIIAVSAVSITFLATLYPSWQASRLDPVEIIRYE